MLVVVSGQSTFAHQLITENAQILFNKDSQNYSKNTRNAKCTKKS